MVYTENTRGLVSSWDVRESSTRSLGDDVVRRIYGNVVKFISESTVDTDILAVGDVNNWSRICRRVLFGINRVRLATN